VSDSRSKVTRRSEDSNSRLGHRFLLCRYWPETDLVAADSRR